MNTAIALKKASESYKIFSQAMLDFVKEQYYGKAQAEAPQAQESETPEH